MRTIAVGPSGSAPRWIAGALLAAALATSGRAQTRQPDWRTIEPQTLQHYTSLLKIDTSDPPGNEKPAAEYLKQVLEGAGIPVQLYESEPNRVNVVARLKGNGSRRPILMMSHTDVVTVDPKKWKFPPFSATRDGGYVYARGATDDKDNLTASLMTLLLLKQMNTPLSRDVIFLAEAGEEGSTRVGIDYMVKQHFADIDAEFCLAETGGVSRRDGRVQFATIQTAEKTAFSIDLVATGISGHGSVPLTTNAIAHLAKAVTAAAEWKPPVRLNDTTRAYFERLARLAAPADAARYRAVLNPDSPAAAAAVDYFAVHAPAHASMLRSSISPVIVQAGYRMNVIPSEAKATLDVRLVPGDDPADFLQQVRRVVGDPAVRVDYAPRDARPRTTSAKLDSEAFAAIETAVAQNYDAPVLPTMSTGATDMAYLRAKGMQCYGIGPAVDDEDAAKGFGAHSDQERLLESELHRFVRFNFDIVSTLARVR
ncbi:MAG TPA: M20/M25/M40 family metallo-hydrolase [Vicinamibacterales bacterium]|jgi:acetylornithine deacetylase/succinyl-diaminopimelate desuccinylase-like protein